VDTGCERVSEPFEPLPHDASKTTVYETGRGGPYSLRPNFEPQCETRATSTFRILHRSSSQAYWAIEDLVCPICGDQVRGEPPVGIDAEWSHTDGTPLCGDSDPVEAA
jgi:hypothetical protein